MPGLRDVHLTSIYVQSHCHRSPLIGVSSPSRSHFTCVLVESHLNLSPDNCISAPPRSNYTPIQVSRYLCLTAIHALLNSIQAPRFMAPPSRSSLTPTQVPIIAYHLHPGDVSPPARLQQLHLRSIETPSQTHPGFKMNISPPPWSCPTWIHS